MMEVKEGEEIDIDKNKFSEPKMGKEEIIDVVISLIKNNLKARIALYDEITGKSHIHRDVTICSLSYDNETLSVKFYKKARRPIEIANIHSISQEK